MPRKTQSEDRKTRRGTRRKRADALAIAPAAPPALPAAQTGADKPGGPELRNHRELAQAIFAQCDPVQVGRDLLESGSEKGASVRARMFETLADWQFGPAQRSSAPASDRPTVRILWQIPGPPRESEEDPK